jgi:hypothetical protein
VRETPTASVLTRSRPTESHRNRQLLCWQCGGAGHPRRVLTENCQECGRQTQLEAELEAALERKAGG